MGAILGIPSMEMLLEWSLAQVPAQDSLTRGGVARLLDEVRGSSSSNESGFGAPNRPSVSERSVPLDDVVVFNRSHLRIFSSDPAYRDIFTYINSFGPDWIDVAEIMGALSLAGRRAYEMLEQLSELGVIVIRDGKCRATKRNFYFPDDEDFFELRNINFQHNADRIMNRLKYGDLLARQAYRGLVTRELTVEQVALLMTGIDQLLGQLVALPETSQPRTIYSLCVLFGERFSRVTERGTD